MSKRLAVFLAGTRMGAVVEDDRGRLSFRYDDQWLQQGAVPLSLSMPLALREHSDRTVRAFLWGLLPDNERVLERWARTYQVSDRNPFALLNHVGEDCAGAVQLVRPNRVDAIAAGEGGIDWIDEDEIARRLRALGSDLSARLVDRVVGRARDCLTALNAG